ncbi:hypothetical protein HNQ08_003143 [Deinococcus humi]|uniref:Uncharacterized protein n=1 Tax=Deinococcus humi TaxID=662880 RepID=A0A7W8NF44_9DEIO|nr:hypothetical protein [Deinococcus humi]
MKKLLALAVMALPAAAAVPASGQFGASAKVALLMLEGKTAPCKNPALNTAAFQTACATVP